MSGHANLIPIAKLVGPRRWNKTVKIGFKTVACRSDDGFMVRLHSTTVIAYNTADNKLLVNTGGWHSGITAQRIRHGLAYLGLQLLTSDLPGRWRVADYKGNAWTIRGNSIKLVKRNGEWYRC